MAASCNMFCDSCWGRNENGPFVVSRLRWSFVIDMITGHETQAMQSGESMIAFRCACGKELKINEDWAGSKVKCPECEEILRVPEAGDIREKPIPPKTRLMEDDEGIEDCLRRRSARVEEDEENDRPRRRSARIEEDNDDRPRRKAKDGNGLMIALIVGGVLLLAGGGVGLFFLLSSHDAEVRLAAEKTILSNNMKQITLAMHGFNDAYGRIPAPGFSQEPGRMDTKPPKPLLSWRVAILPLVEPEGALFKQFKRDEPWDGPNNIKLLSRMPKVYEPVGPQPKKDGHTYLQYVTGPGTLFPTLQSFARMPQSFRDGLSNTIMIVEAAEPVPWTKPADFSIDVTHVLEGNVPKLGAMSPHGFFAALGDGSVRFIDRRNVSDRTIRMAFNPADGNPMGPDWQELLQGFRQ